MWDSLEYLGNSKHYATLGKLADKVDDLEWGGNWKSFVDEPHFQLKKYKTISEARETFNTMRWYGIRKEITQGMEEVFW